MCVLDALVIGASLDMAHLTHQFKYTLHLPLLMASKEHQQLMIPLSFFLSLSIGESG